MANSSCTNEESIFLIAIWNEHDRVESFVKTMKGRMFNTVSEVSSQGNYLLKSQFEPKTAEPGTFLVTLSFEDRFRTQTYEICSRHPISDFGALLKAIAQDIRTAHVDFFQAVGFERVLKPYERCYQVDRVETSEAA